MKRPGSATGEKMKKPRMKPAKDPIDNDCGVFAPQGVSQEVVKKDEVRSGVARDMLSKASADGDDSSDGYSSTTGDESDGSEDGVKDGTETVSGAKSFAAMGLDSVLQDIIARRGWSEPTPIQQAAIPAALSGKDVIGLAVTGSGKTGAFAIPIINDMMMKQKSSRIHPFYAIVILPTRELCVQVAEQFRLLGSMLQLKVCCLVGGMSSIDQTKELARQPHILCATPGRLVDHLQNTKGFSLQSVEFLVLDEADRLLSLDFEEALHEIVRNCNPKRQTFLFSATMTSKLSKLQRASLKQPVKVQVDDRTQTAHNLVQKIVLVPMDQKFQYLAAMLKRYNAYRSIVFCNTCKIANVLNVFLQRLNFSTVALTGDMNQSLRLNALGRFKNKQQNILITTEVAARGMDIPDVHYVYNFDVPKTHKDYIHRVGRTARAGKHGSSFTFVTKLDVVQYKLIEERIFGDKEPNELPQTYNDMDLVKEVDLLSKVVNIHDAKLTAEKEYNMLTRAKAIKKRSRRRDDE